MRKVARDFTFSFRDTRIAALRPRALLMLREPEADRVRHGGPLLVLVIDLAGVAAVQLWTLLRRASTASLV